MRKLAAIARTGLQAVLLNPLRTGATLLCLVAVLVPYVAGMGVARGIAEEARISIRCGADLYVGASRFGRPAPVPLEALEKIGAMPGVRSAFPRIVGEIPIGAERIPAVVVGIPKDRLPATAHVIEGALFERPLELVMGRELAKGLRVQVGSRVPPFYRNPDGEHVMTVVGIFRSELPPWEKNLIFCSFETAAEIFAQKELATNLLVECEPAYKDAVTTAIRRLPPFDESNPNGPAMPTVVSREDAELLLPRGLGHLEGVFHLHFVLAFAVGIPLLMVAAGLGLSERRREAALMKATGWMTDEVLLQGLVQSLVLSLIGAATAVLLAYVWLDVLNAKGIANIFLPGAGASPTFRVPFQLAPVPALVGFAVSFAIVSTGTLYSTWRAATAAPALALR